MGRYRDIPLENRLCQVCKNDNVEDEIHFLCQCPKYNELRKMLYNNAAREDPSFHSKDDIDKFVFLMSNLQKPVIRFIYNSISIRTNCLTNSEKT